MKTTHHKKHRQHGFSLIELLTVISVIGIIAGIAIPSMGNVNTAATLAVNQRNAQNIVSTYQSGVSAGVTWTTTNKLAAIADVVAGRAPASGAFTTQTFKVPNVSVADYTAAAPYMIITGTDLTYDKAGGHGTT